MIRREKERKKDIVKMCKNKCGLLSFLPIMNQTMSHCIDWLMCLSLFLRRINYPLSRYQFINIHGLFDKQFSGGESCEQKTQC